jgi:Na+-driven multidrug efflux pump
MNNSNRNIFFGVLHFIVWFISCFLLGWWGVLIGFLVNSVMDTTILLIWVFQEKKQLSSRVAPQQQYDLLVRN